MKRAVLAVLFTAFSFTSAIAAQTSDKELKAATLSLDELAQYDFSPLFADKRVCYYGRMGDDYWRFHIVYDKVKKIAPLTYSVEGQTMFKGNYCDFNGTLTIKANDLPEWADELEYIEEPLPIAGIVTSEVIFSEDSRQKGSGIFKGAFRTNWYIDMNDRLVYDDTYYENDSYANNQFAGVWTSHKTGAQKISAWGHYRIPISRDLDIGAGEFSVDSAYIKNGWQLKDEDLRDFCDGLLYPPKWRKK